MQEVAHIANGSHPGNCISVLRVRLAELALVHVVYLCFIAKNFSSSFFPQLIGYKTFPCIYRLLTLARTTC